MRSSNLYFYFFIYLFCIQLFPTFFRVHAFLGPGLGSRSRVWIHVLEVDDAKQLY